MRHDVHTRPMTVARRDSEGGWVLRMRWIASALMVIGGLEWTVAAVYWYVSGHGGLEGAPGLALIAFGLAVPEHPRVVEDRRLRLALGLGFVGLGVAAAWWPPRPASTPS